MFGLTLAGLVGGLHGVASDTRQTLRLLASNLLALGAVAWAVYTGCYLITTGTTDMFLILISYHFYFIIIISIIIIIIGTSITKIIKITYDENYDYYNHHH